MEQNVLFLLGALKTLEVPALAGILAFVSWNLLKVLAWGQRRAKARRKAAQRKALAERIAADAEMRRNRVIRVRRHLKVYTLK